MSHEQTPTGILILAYGSPDTLDDVEPYFTHIRGGRKPSPEAVERLRERYRLVGGRTPLKELTFAVAEGVQARLDADAPGRYRVFVGMKHWHPFIAEAVARILEAGIGEVTAVVLAPHYSRYSLEGYRTHIEQALAGAGRGFALRFVESWHAHPGFRSLIAQRIRETLGQFPPEARDDVRVVFSAHSLPEKILAAGDPYPEQLRESAAGIAALLGLRDWRLCYQSAGMTGEPWLGPDILECLEELRAEGARHVLSVPFGFVADHLEVLWDIDAEAQQKAAELGVALRRIRMPNADPEFVDLITAIARESAAS
ncbi:MAG: ferrochelatase [Chloroflexota bacterium]|nr:MAG: ferrochelatase [Chloroflexota bacterium]